MNGRIYAAIDLKSFFASVECRERDLDPLSVNLVVADESRTEKTICLAVSPSLKAYGISGRARLFEVIQRVAEVNNERLYNYRRLMKNFKAQFKGSSFFDNELKNDPSLAADYIIAPPAMSRYIKYSLDVYNIYLKYIAPEDIHVYSIDEVFMDVTDYLFAYKMTARELVRKIVSDILKSTGITATAGIGTNLYLCKIAMDIVAKKMPADKDGVRIAELDEKSYREKLWTHKPLTAFWRIGRGYAEKLEYYGMHTMGDIAEMSQTEYGEDFLYRLFGINAELLIDHAWGYESCTMADIKAYRPQSKSLSSGQVLKEPYDFETARTVLVEMADALSLKLVSKNLVTDKITVTVGYDKENLRNAEIRSGYHGETVFDRYGRRIPRHAHKTASLGRFTSSAEIIMKTAGELFDSSVNSDLSVRRLNISAENILTEENAKEQTPPVQLDFFGDSEKNDILEEKLKKERSMQLAIAKLKNRYGKNAVLRGLNFTDGATAIERNGQIGGHKA